MHSNPFKIGDAVVILSGTAPRRVTDIHPTGFMSTRYLSDEDQRYNPPPDRHYSCFRFYNTQETDMTNQIEKGQLFQTIGDNPEFGQYLATGSGGKIVLEMKDGIRAFNRSEVTEVTPYTVRVHGVTHATGQTFELAGAIELKVHDVIIVLNEASKPYLAVVQAVDTKAKSAPVLNFKKLVTADELVAA